MVQVQRLISPILFRGTLDSQETELLCGTRRKGRRGKKDWSGEEQSCGAIMRTVGDEGINGQVEIDGVDIKNIGIDTLRNGVGLIPQEPFLFEGTVR